MSTDIARKICADHLRRDAFLYVRQCSMRLVFENTENTESTRRQYSLRDGAVALGWPIEQVHVIDNDLGMCAAQSQDGDGFQHLVTEVAMGHSGIVLGLEVSRLACNNADWHRFLEMAALLRTLIMDEDGVYAPASFNDRKLLGLKGTMSEGDGRRLVPWRYRQRRSDERVSCGMTSVSAMLTSSSGSRVCTRSATIAASSIGESTALRRSSGPIGLSSTDCR